MLSRQRVLDPCWTAAHAIAQGIHIVNSASMPSLSCVNCFLADLEKKKNIMAQPVCLIA